MARVAAILLGDKGVALIRRVRAGETYYLFPGGTVEAGETDAQALRREMLEELSLQVEVQALVAETVFEGVRQSYYLCRAAGGRFGPGAGGEYSGSLPAREGSYEPVWMPLARLEAEPVRPRCLCPLVLQGAKGCWPSRPLRAADLGEGRFIELAAGEEARFIPERCGDAFPVPKGGAVTVVDLMGGQVADFYAVAEQGEFLSPSATMDVNTSVYAGEGDILYSSRYRPMFRLERDDVGGHDLLHPSCCPEMFNFFYGNGEGHPNCRDNLNAALAPYGVAAKALIRPVNLFMNTVLEQDGRFTVQAPRSAPGDRVMLRALLDVTAAVAACSVSESACNAGRCTPLLALLRR